jgi:hypothetical protein
VDGAGATFNPAPPAYINTVSHPTKLQHPAYRTTIPRQHSALPCKAAGSPTNRSNFAGSKSELGGKRTMTRI